MKPLPKHANVVIVGAGIAGVSMAYFLSELGWRDIIVIDQGKLPLPGGSSSHAPGGMFQTHPSKMMTDAAHFGVHFYHSLQFDGQNGAELCGGLELAETEARIIELHRRCGLGRSYGLKGEVISAQACGDLLPHLDVSQVKAGYYVPDDGVGRAVICTQAIQAKAEANGVRFFDQTAVQNIITKEDKLGRASIERLITNRGDIQTETMVCCCGFWGPKLGRMVGQAIPLMPMAHLYGISQSIPALANATQEIQLPITRSQDNDLYFRQHFDKWGLGYYGHKAKSLWSEDILSPEEAPIMPSLIDWSEQDFQAGWQAGSNLFPSIGKTQNLSDQIYGVFSFTTDGFPVMGESLKVKGFWSAQAFWYTHAAGLAKMVAEWMDSGEPQCDCHEGDINRFYPHEHSRSFTKQRGTRQYIEVYDILHPKVPSGVCRNLRQSPIHQRHLDWGGYLLESAGYERPQWYEKNLPLLSKLPKQPKARDAWSEQHYSPIEAAEAWVARNQTALFDLSAFAVFSVVGEDSLNYLQALCTNNIDVPAGRMVYTNLLNTRGGIVCDLTLMRQATNAFLIITGGASGPHDFAWLTQHLPDHANAHSVYLSDVSSQYSVFGLWGPNTHDLLHTISNDDFSHPSIPFFNFKNAFIDEIPVTVGRLSYIGERGFELYTETTYALALWDKLVSAGAIPCGQGAFDSLRVEKGMLGWGADLDDDHTPLEARLNFIVKWEHDFKGKKALLTQKQNGIEKRITTLVIEDGTVLLGKEAIFDAQNSDTCLGYVSSANYGHTVDRSIALSYLPISHIATGTTVWIDYLGTRHKATVSEDVLFDPDSTRLKP